MVSKMEKCKNIYIYLMSQALGKVCRKDIKLVKIISWAVFPEIFREGLIDIVIPGLISDNN